MLQRNKIKRTIQTALLTTTLLTTTTNAFTIKDILEIYEKPYIIYPVEETTYITTTTTYKTTTTITTQINNKTITQAETTTQAPYNQTIATIEPQYTPEIDIDIKIDPKKPPEIEEILKHYKKYLIITKDKETYIIKPKYKLTLTLTQEEETGDYEELYQKAKQYQNKQNNNTQTKTLYPLIPIPELLIICEQEKIKCIPTDEKIIAIATEQQQQKLKNYTTQNKPKYKITAIITTINEKAKKEITIDITTQNTTNTTTTLTIDPKKPLFNTLLLKLKTQEEQGNAVIISQPELIVEDKEEAKIETGYQIPVITPGTTTTPPTATFKNATLSLSVKPQKQGEQIKLTITLTKDTPDYTNKIGENIPIQTNQITTTITTKPNETIIIGGIKEQQTNKNKTTPAIPILKWIFGERTQTQETKELYIIITIQQIE